MTVAVGDRLRCLRPGSTLLVEGRVYTVAYVSGLTDGLFEVKELLGVLWGMWRFEPA